MKRKFFKRCLPCCSPLSHVLRAGLVLGAVCCLVLALGSCGGQTETKTAAHSDLRNVKLLRQVSWCCVGAGAVCLVSCLYYLPFIAVAIAAGFMALLVRIVKNIFQQAIDMKAELDLTI